jgi:hypothetical protein
MKNGRKIKQLIAIGISLLVMLACSLPSGGNSSPASPASSGLEETRIVLGVQATSLAQKATDMASAPEPAEPIAQQVQPTLEPLPTYTPYPTQEPPAPAATAQPPTAEPTQDVMTRMKSANILVFEDIQGYPALNTRISMALTGLGLTSGKVVKVGDAVGNFMKNLNSSMQWDLIIVGAEARNGVRGEFWDVISEQVNRNVALIAEIWYLDEIANGRISSLMSRCGVYFQRDWTRAKGYNIYNYSIFWLDQFNPVFSDPNVVEPLLGPTIYWTQDAGDIIGVTTGSKATLLAGTNQNNKTSGGVLASCMDGRMILQTFSTHDYKQSATVALWQNFIVNTLKAHYAVAQ